MTRRTCEHCLFWVRHTQPIFYAMPDMANPGSTPLTHVTYFSGDCTGQPRDQHGSWVMKLNGETCKRFEYKEPTMKIKRRKQRTQSQLAYDRCQGGTVIIGTVYTPIGCVHVNYASRQAYLWYESSHGFFDATVPNASASRTAIIALAREFASQVADLMEGRRWLT